MLRGFLRTDGKPTGWERRLLPLLPFVVCFVAYVVYSNIRHAANPDDKLFPLVSQIAKSFWNYATVTQLGDKVPELWIDTWVTGKLILICIALLFPISLLGLVMGLMPYAESIWGKFIIAYALIAPVGMAPILMVLLGIDMAMKITLVTFAMASIVVRGTQNAAQSVPQNLIFLAQSRRATEFEVCYSIILPMIFPQILNVIRQLLPALISILLFADGLVAKTQYGFMYRMNVAQRHGPDMALIISVALWIVFLTFILDLLTRLWILWCPNGKAS